MVLDNLLDVIIFPSFTLADIPVIKSHPINMKNQSIKTHNGSRKAIMLVIE